MQNEIGMNAVFSNSEGSKSCSFIEGKVMMHLDGIKLLVCMGSIFFISLE